MRTHLKKTCRHCDPVRAHPLHPFEKAQKLFWPILSLFRKIGGIAAAHGRLYKWLLDALFRSLIAVRLLTEKDPSTSKRMDARMRLAISELRRRSYTVRNLSFLGAFDTSLFTLRRQNGPRIFFDKLPTIEIGHTQPVPVDNKAKFKMLLAAHALPYPEGASFRSRKRALRYVRQLGFPLVVKPESTSLSKHVRTNVRTEEELLRAIRIVKQISRKFIVERHINGAVHRATLVDYTLAACCRREAPNVVGDGRRTVRALIEAKNSSPERGERTDTSKTLHKIEMSHNARTLLRQQGYTLSDIPPSGEKVYLHQKVTLSCGADIHDCTSEVHPRNKEMLESVARTSKSPLIGLDFICKNVAAPYVDQPFAVIEANSAPYIDMHLFPTTGTPRNVAPSMVDLIDARYS